MCIHTTSIPRKILCRTELFIHYIILFMNANLFTWIPTELRPLCKFQSLQNTTSDLAKKRYFNKVWLISWKLFYKKIIYIHHHQREYTTIICWREWYQKQRSIKEIVHQPKRKWISYSNVCKNDRFSCFLKKTYDMNRACKIASSF